MQLTVCEVEDNKGMKKRREEEKSRQATYEQLQLHRIYTHDHQHLSLCACFLIQVSVTAVSQIISLSRTQAGRETRENDGQQKICCIHKLDIES